MSVRFPDLGRAALVLLALATSASASPSKKAELLAAKATARAQPARTATAVLRPNVRPAKLVNLYNTWTHEWLAIDPASKRAIEADTRDHFLRCHYTNEATAMDARLLSTVVAAAQHFHVDTVQIVSGFRHPKYNLMLRKKGHEVARDSQHTHGNAIDFYLPGIATKDLHAWALAQKLGGVGLYMNSGFVHMDTGRVRTWNGD
ncbi:MAG: DUF882 domain-containing protein [Deltaproteobacteria bacterium]|nr:DUF882 domain-containing protein [Deltaproteobacteria bacterium]